MRETELAVITLVLGLIFIAAFVAAQWEKACFIKNGISVCAYIQDIEYKHRKHFAILTAQIHYTVNGKVYTGTVDIRQADIGSYRTGDSLVVVCLQNDPSRVAENPYTNVHYWFAVLGTALIIASAWGLWGFLTQQKERL